MKIRTGYVVALFLVLAVLAAMGNEFHNQHCIHSAVNLWQNRLDHAHLIGASKSSVLAYLHIYGIPSGDTKGEFDSTPCPSDVKYNSINQLGSDYEIEVFHIGTTHEPLPLYWKLSLNFQFDKKGKLLFFNVAPYPDVMDIR